MEEIRAFFDADALYTASSSKKGASFALANKRNITLVSSSECVHEAEEALKRTSTNHFLHEIISNFEIQDYIIKSEHKELIYDKNDLHVISSAIQSNSNFLITYNLKDFNIDKIEHNFDIRVIQPKFLLFYIRNVID